MLKGEATTQLFTLNVSDRALNRPPTITSTPEITTNIQRLYQYQLAATDPDGDLLLWQLENAPRGMVIDAETGVLTWQPEATQIGEHTITVEVVDSQGLLSGQEYTLKVTGTNSPPAIVSTPITQGAVGQEYNYQAVATDPENDTLTYTLALSPEGMSIDEATGQITWSPTTEQLGTQTVEVLVEDTQGGSNRQRFTVEVQSQAINNAPEITSTPAYLADTGNVYSYEVTATDADNDNLTYELIAAPNGITINPATGEITWNNPVVGNHQIVVGVNDGNLGAAQSYTLTVIANQAPQITADPVIAALPNQTYSYDLKAFDPEGQPLTYSLDPTSVSLGMTIDEYGRLRWSPSNTDIGNHNVTVTATDPLGATDQRTYNLTVTADTEAPKAKLLISDVYVVEDELQGDINQQIRLQVLATDNIGVTGLQLLINNQPVAIDSNGLATITLDQLGTTTAKVVAYDGAGNVGITTDEVLVLDPANNDPPVVSLALTENEITAPIDIVGTVSDGNNDLNYYTLEVAPADGSAPFVEMSRGSSEIDNGVLGEFDPTVLANGSYILKLTAYDSAGNFSATEEVVDVSGNLKLGNFTLSFTDMQIPVSGIPISVTRTYDSLNANSSDEFGYGWRLEFRDTDLQTSVEPPDLIQKELGEYSPFKEDSKVYITLPGGKRETFTFKARPSHLNAYLRGPAGNAGVEGDVGMYHPEFESEEGSTNTLTVRDLRLRKNSQGEYYGLVGQPYNPADSYFGGVYTLTTKEGIAYDIDAVTGDLLTVTDTNGNTLTFSDDGISSDTGVSVTFERDAEGRIVKAIDPEGEEVKYEYDEEGDLVAVTDREENTTQFKYEEATRPHFLTEIIDPLGRTGVKTEYDEKGRLKKLLDVNGEAIELDYDPDNSIQTVRDVFGNPTTYEYDIRGNVLTEIDAVGKVTKRTYNDDNNVLTETIVTNESGVEGWTTSYTYDGQGNILSETDPLGNTTRYTYNSDGQLLTNTDALGNTTEYTFTSVTRRVQSVTDAEGNVINYRYDLRGNPTRIIEGDDDVTQFSYDQYGNRTRKIDALGNETTYTYDAQGNVLTETMTMTLPDGQTRTLATTTTYDSEGNPLTVLDAEGNLTTYEYDANGNQTLIIDAQGRRTEQRYDEKNNLTETILPDDTPNDLSDNPTIKFAYDALGNRTTVTNPDGNTTYYKYDPLNRPTEMIVHDDTPDDLSDNPRIEVEYDQAGRLKSITNEAGNRTEYEFDNAGRPTVVRSFINGQVLETITTYDAVGRETSIIDALGRKTEYKYDQLGQLIETIFSDGTSLKTEYDEFGNIVAETDQHGRTTRYEYNALDQLTAVIDTLGERTEYDYDEAGNLIYQEDAQGQITRYEYDGLGRLTALERPLEQRSEIVYDKVGNVVLSTDFNGDTIEYSYNELNQLIAKNLSGEDPFIKYTYTTTGQIETITDQRGQTTYTYNEQGLLESRTEPDGRQISYTYNDGGLVETVTTPSGTITYEYDQFNRLEKVIGTDPTDITTYTYDDLGNLETTTYSNGVVETRGYDELNRLISVVNEDGTGNIFSSYTYTLDNVGNRTLVEELGGRQVAYTYDELYRLTKEEITDPVNGNRTIEYTYDEVGNRTSRQDSVAGETTYSYDDNDRLLSETTAGVTTSYSYDDNGNLTLENVQGSQEQIEYTWDEENRLIAARVTDASGSVQEIEYEYDAQGIRVSTTVDGVETRYLIDANRPYAQVVEEYDSNGDVEVAYLYGLDLLSQSRGDEDLFYLEDGHSGVRQLSDEAGVVADTYSYDAYGNLLSVTGSSENNYLYRGEQFDPHLDMQYLRARYYDSQTGRFASVDPFEGFVEEPITRHRYVYGADNPITYVDPSGAITMSDILASLAILGILAASFQQSYASAAQRASGIKEDVTWSGILVSLSGGSFPNKPIPSFDFGLGATVFSVESSIIPSPTDPGYYRVSDGLVIAVHSNFSLKGLGARKGITPVDFAISAYELKSPAILGIGEGILRGGYITSTIAASVGVEKGTGLGPGYGLQGILMGYAQGNANGYFGSNVHNAALALGIGISIPIGFEYDRVEDIPS